MLVQGGVKRLGVGGLGPALASILLGSGGPGKLIDWQDMADCLRNDNFGCLRNDNFGAVTYRLKGLFPRVLARTDARQANASRV
jgi:hypothetical protein